MQQPETVSDAEVRFRGQQSHVLCLKFVIVQQQEAWKLFRSPLLFVMRSHDSRVSLSNTRTTLYRALQIVFSTSLCKFSASKSSCSLAINRTPYPFFLRVYNSRTFLAVMYVTSKRKLQNDNLSVTISVRNTFHSYLITIMAQTVRKLVSSLRSTLIIHLEPYSLRFYESLADRVVFRIFFSARAELFRYYLPGLIISLCSYRYRSDFLASRSHQIYDMSCRRGLLCLPWDCGNSPWVVHEKSCTVGWLLHS